MIEPRYQSERVTLYCADCLDILPQLAPMDAVVTDPPWHGCDIVNAGQDPDSLLAASVAAASPKRLVVQLGCDVDPRGLSLVRGLPFLRVCWLEYVQPNYKGRILYTGDVAYVFGEPPPSRPGHHVLPGRYIHCNGDARPSVQLHPCARQLTHVRWLASKFTAPDDIVLDPFMGSGTTGVAAMQLGRRFIGIEIDERYYQIAEKRIRDAEAQLLLPGVS